MELAHKILNVANLFGYGEIRDGGYTSVLMSAFTNGTDPVYPALQKWCNRGGLVTG